MSQRQHHSALRCKKMTDAIAAHGDIATFLPDETTQKDISAAAEKALHEREAWLNGQKLAFQAAMSGQPLAISLKPLIETIIGQTNGEARAAFYVVPDISEGLQLIAGMTEEFAHDVKGFKVGPDSVSCGLAMYTGEPVITPDVELEPAWKPFLPMAQKYQVRSCWSFPVKTNEESVLGTFALYFKQPRKPDAREIELVGILSHAAAIIVSRHNESVERTRAEVALRKSETKYRNEVARLHAILRSISDAVYIGDLSGITLANQPALDQLGYSSHDELNKNIGILSVEIQTRDVETNEIISPDCQAFARALAGEYVVQNVRIWHRKSGLDRIVRSAASPVIVDGKIVAAVAVNTDITAQWQINTSLRESEKKLQQFNDELEQQVQEGAATFGKLELKQKAMEERREAEIFRAILDAQEAERKRIAENLHNGLGQTLYAAKLSLGALNKFSVPENDRENLKNADKLLNDAINESRRLSHELMPAILEDFGLKVGIEDICRNLNGKTLFKCQFKGPIKQLDKYIRMVIYRLVQELLMNVVKHSQASNALVAIEVFRGHVLVLVQDDGKGFSPSKEKADGIGLKTIRSNVSLLNGNIAIASKPGKGSTINIDIPFKL